MRHFELRMHSHLSASSFLLIAVHVVARLATAAACEDPLAFSRTLGLSVRSQYMLVYVSINPRIFVNQETHCAIPYMVVIRSPNIVVDRRSPGMTPGQTHLLCSSLSRVEDLTVPLLAHAVPAQRTDVGT